MSEAGRRILEGVHDAIAGDFASVTIDGQTWAPAPRWQPMETAPKDGTRMLMFAPNHLIMLGSWAGHARYGGPTWYSNNVTIIPPPTHWMPIPPPPEGGAS